MYGYDDGACDEGNDATCEYLGGDMPTAGTKAGDLSLHEPSSLEPGEGFRMRATASSLGCALQSYASQSLEPVTTAQGQQCNQRKASAQLTTSSVSAATLLHSDDSPSIWGCPIKSYHSLVLEIAVLRKRKNTKEGRHPAENQSTSDRTDELITKLTNETTALRPK